MESPELPEITTESWLLDAAFRQQPCGWFAQDESGVRSAFNRIANACTPRGITSVSFPSKGSAIINLNCDGGRIDFWSMDNRQAGRGYSYKRVVIDGFDPEIWALVIRPCLFDQAGEALIVR